MQGQTTRRYLVIRQSSGSVHSIEAVSANVADGSTAARFGPSKADSRPLHASVWAMSDAACMHMRV
jgi:hypothetical protein